MPCRPVELCSLSCNHHAMAATTLGDIERITSCALWRSTRARPIGSSGAGVGAGLHYPKAVTTAGGSADAPLVYRPSLGPPKVRGEVWTTQREELWRRLSSTQRGGGPRLRREQVPLDFARNTQLSSTPPPPRSVSSLHMDPAAGVFPSSECALCSLPQSILSLTSPPQQLARAVGAFSSPISFLDSPHLGAPIPTAPPILRPGVPAHGGTSICWPTAHSAVSPYVSGRLDFGYSERPATTLPVYETQPQPQRGVFASPSAAPRGAAGAPSPYAASFTTMSL